MNIKPSLCCISLELQENGIRANTITKKRFLTLENQSRQTALSTISERVLNNINVVKETLKFCISKNWNYRISSNIFPLATLPEANLSYETLPNHDEIVATFNKCKCSSICIKTSGASTNKSS